MSEDRLRSSFGAVAPSYERHRPDYAQAAVAWAISRAAGAQVGDLGGRVLDLGAGTGKLTATLAALGAEVVAVEPDPAMLRQLRSAMPSVRALPGSAEALPVPDASVDVVVAGNAMHWFDLDVAAPELHRVLRPGGVLAGLWNVFDDRVDWVADLVRIADAEAIGPRDTLSAWHAQAAFPDLGALPGFDSEAFAAFDHGQERTADSLVATFATKAGMVVMPSPRRQAALERIGRFLHDRPETAGEFTLPLVTGVRRVTRV